MQYAADDVCAIAKRIKEIAADEKRPPKDEGIDQALAKGPKQS